MRKSYNVLNQRQLLFQSQGKPGRLADLLAEPIMRFVSGAQTEEPQRTHYWNNIEIDPGQFVVKRALSVVLDPDPEAGPRRKWGIIPTMHLPQAKGGWKKYVVVQPHNLVPGQDWSIGWQKEDGGICLSIIPLQGPVRTLRGDKESLAFGLNAHGEQQALSLIGSGTIGDSGLYSQIPFR